MQTVDIKILYNQHYNGILGYFIKNFNGDRTLAEDLAQDTFFKILRHSLCHIGFSYTKQYIYKVAENVKFDHIRRGKGLPTIDIDNIAIPLLIEYPIIDCYGDYRSTLQPTERALYELLIEGYNSFELAKIFNVTPSAVRARIAKLKKSLRKTKLDFS